MGNLAARIDDRGVPPTERLSTTSQQPASMHTTIRAHAPATHAERYSHTTSVCAIASRATPHPHTWSSSRSAEMAEMSIIFAHDVIHIVVL